MKRVLMILFFLGHQAAFGQGGFKGCSLVFDQMTERVEANYIGLKHFQDQGKGAEYEKRKSDFSARAKVVRAEDCTGFLQEFLDYFEDGHISALELPQYTQDQMDSIGGILHENKVSVSEIEKSLNEQLSKSNKPESEQVIGKYSDGSSDFIVIKEDDWFKAFIVKSEKENSIPGELKAYFRWSNHGLRGRYYSYGHVPSFLKGGLYKDGMLLRLGSFIWIKTNSSQTRELDAVNFESTNFPTIRKIDNDNVLFTVPRFSVDNKVWNDLVKKNREILLNAKNLIFDIRGNRGGNAIYFSTFYLFADREMPGGQGHVLASEDNLKYFERNMQYSKKIYGPVVEAIKANLGEIVDGPLYPKRNYKRSKKSKIENVAILTDEACMSAAESFIIHTRQASSLVKTFGTSTDGVIDYTSVSSVLLKASGNQRILFAYPTSTLHKGIPDKGYNKTGMVPDVPIAAGVKDKVGFIMEYYRKN